MQPSGPMLDKAEMQAIGKAVAMLRPFAGQLVKITEGQATDDQIVDELEGFVPGGMVESLLALAALVKKHGKDVLAVIHPALATDRWATIVNKLAERMGHV